MSVQKPPVDYALIRKTIVAQVEKITGLKCIRNEPVSSDSPRPELPYFGYKITTPGTARGEPSFTYTGNGSVYNYGSQLKMDVSFNLYARDQDEAYAFMILLQQSLNKQTVLEEFRKAGLAIWDFGNVADLSALLNTGYEARTQMDVHFGLASNLTDDQGRIDSVEIDGIVDENGIVLNVP